METNIYDLIVDKLHERKTVVKDMLTKRYKKTTPFRMEPVDNDQLLYVYENMASQDVQYGIAQYGRDAMNDFIFEMEKSKQRRGM